MFASSSDFASSGSELEMEADCGLCRTPINSAARVGDVVAVEPNVFKSTVGHLAGALGVSKRRPGLRQEAKPSAQTPTQSSCRRMPDFSDCLIRCDRHDYLLDRALKERMRAHRQAWKSPADLRCRRFELKEDQINPYWLNQHSVQRL